MRLSLDRLWLVIAIGLPVLVALLVPHARGRPRLPGPRGRRDPADRHAPRRRHVDLHGRRHDLDRPAVAGAGPAEPRLPGRWLGAARGCPCGAHRGGDGVHRWPRRWRGAPATGRPRSWRCSRSRWPRRRSRCGPSCSGSRSSRGSCGSWRPARPIRVDSGSRPCSSSCGRTCTARSCWRPSSSATRGSTTSLADGLGDRSLAVLVVGRPRDARQPVRAGRMGLRGGDRRQPRDHRARQRVAADHAALRAGGAVLRVGDRRR